MGKHYEQLTAEERVTIMSMTTKKDSARAIGRLLRRAPSTVSREFTRFIAGHRQLFSAPAPLTASLIPLSVPTSFTTLAQPAHVFGTYGVRVGLEHQCTDQAVPAQGGTNLSLHS